MDTYVTQ